MRQRKKVNSERKSPRRRRHDTRYEKRERGGKRKGGRGREYQEHVVSILILHMRRKEFKEKMLE